MKEHKKGMCGFLMKSESNCISEILNIVQLMFLLSGNEDGDVCIRGLP